MADTQPRVPTLEDIRWLFDQLPPERSRGGDRNASPPAQAPEETPDE